MNKFKQKLSAYFRGRNFTSLVLVSIVICAVVFLNMILYMLTSAFGWYLYSPEELDLSITDSSDALFADAESGMEVTVTFCMFESELKEHSTGSFVYKTALQFAERYPDLIKLKYANIYTRVYDDLERTPFNPDAYAKGTYPDGTEYDNIILPTSVIFECKQTDGASVVWQDYKVVTDVYTSTGFGSFSTLASDGSSITETSYNGEEVFASMVHWVMTKEHGTAYVTVGHGEIADPSLSSALTSAGYYVKYLDLKEEDVPTDAEIVVISNPRHDFERGASGTDTELERLESYRNRGGSFYVTLDPLADKLVNLEGFLSGYGLSVEYNEADGERALVKDTVSGIPGDGFTLIASYAKDGTAADMKAKSESDGGGVLLRALSPITVDKSKGAEALLYSSSAAVLHRAGATVDTAGSYPLAAISTYENRDGSESKLFLSAGIYLTSSDNMITEGYSNKSFLYSLFDVFFEKGNMPYGCRSVVYENTLLENLTMGTATAFTAAMLAIPVLLAAVGTVVLVRRRNR